MVDYINKVYLKETQFSIKFTGDADGLIEQLQKYKKANGKFRFEIKKRKIADEHGNSHYIQVDDWEPNKPKEEPVQEKYSDEIPF